MASHLAIDVVDGSLRFVEIEGTLKRPVIKSFGVVSRAEFEEAGDPIKAAAKALNAKLKEAGAQREPSGIALDAARCTFRELDLPYTSDADIAKVVKFEAESHLHLLDIDEVVVSYQRLRTGMAGSRLLVMAYEKSLVLEDLAICQGAGVDPQFADLHLTAQFIALRESGYLGPIEPDGDDEDAAPAVDLPVLVLECEPHVTNVLVVQGEQLLAARAVRIGWRLPGPGADIDGEGLADDGSEADPLLVIDDLSDGNLLGGGEPVALTADYFLRLKREVQRTLLPLGFSEEVSEVVLGGALATDESFQRTLGEKLGLDVSVARPFDEFSHKLDEENLAQANAHGCAALGVALRLLGAAHSQVDFRQEECRYAKRFDQVKVAIACLAIMLFIAVGLPTIETLKRLQINKASLHEAASAALKEYQYLAEDTSLRDQLDGGAISPLQATVRVRAGYKKACDEIATELGREGELPRVDSGLDYLQHIFTLVDSHLNVIQRLELNQIEIDLGGEKPELSLKGKVVNDKAADDLVAALAKAEVTVDIDRPKLEPAADGRRDFTGLSVKLRKAVDMDPGGSAP
jgi:Tfp pilus assembly PilM family ATPase